MRFAADLHLHSRYAKAVSKDMTLETLGRYARRKGIDVMGTGDCLQPAWLDELEQRLAPAEQGWFAIRPEEERTITKDLPPRLHQPLRFVLSTEVHCAPPGTGELHGIHHLLYFPTFASARAFQKKLERYGDLTEGRPVVRLASRELLELAADHGVPFAPAHVMNPYFSTLGSREKHPALEEVFGDLTPQIFAAELGLTSIPPMCRRIGSLDNHALFANSDAHSPENIGRECTLLEIEPGFDNLFSALRQGTRDQIVACLKYSIHRTRYFLNWCARCERPYDGPTCPQGHGRLPTGSRDWLEQIATREAPAALEHTPRFRMYVPLRELLSEFYRLGPKTKKVSQVHEDLLEKLGHERFILTQASEEELGRACEKQLADAIVSQRAVNFRSPIQIAPYEPPQPQAELSF